MENSKYCVCTATNDAYTRGAEIMLYSFLLNNKWFKGDVVILCGKENSQMSLSEDNRKKISNIYGNVIFREVDYSEVSEVTSRMRNYSVGKEALFYKLVAFKMEQYEKILFLDSDLLVIGDIFEFFDRKEPFVICPDIEDTTYNDRLWSGRTEEYCNSGVFLVNEQYIRESMMDEFLSIFEYVDFSKKTRWNPHNGRFGDQDIINAYFIGKNVFLAPSKFYNLYNLHFNERNNEVKILHYWSFNKPFLRNFGNGVSISLWKKYENEYKEWLSKKEKKKSGYRQKIVGITFTFNEETLVPYVMEYWKRLGIEKLVVYDNESTDKTVELLKQYPFVEVKSWSSAGKFDDLVLTKLRNNVWKAENADWIIMSDFDEVPYCEIDINDFLSNPNATVIRTYQYNVIRENLPDFNGFLVHQLEGNLFQREGIRMDKVHTFNPKLIEEMNFQAGCHYLNPKGNVAMVEYPEQFYFFHLRYLGKNFILKRCKMEYDRLPETYKKTNGLSFHLKKTITNYDEIASKIKNGAVENYKDANTKECEIY